MTPEFKTYMQQVVKNAQAMAGALQQKGWRIVSGGTDNHLMLVDLAIKNLTGKDASAALDKARITVNKNAIPFDPTSPMVSGGIRIGTPAVTTRGMKEGQMQQIAGFIDKVMNAMTDEGVAGQVARDVEHLTNKFPLYPELLKAIA